MADKQFPAGIFYKAPRQNAPEFVKGSINIKVDELIPYLQANAKNGWVNLDLKKSKKGIIYLDLNDWTPNQQNTVQEKVQNSDWANQPENLPEEPMPEEPINIQNIPF